MYLVPERRVLLPQGVDLLPQPAVRGGPATLLPPQLLLQGAELLPQGLAEERGRRGQGGQALLLAHRVVSFRSVGWSDSSHCHLDLLPLLLVGDGSGGRQVLLEHFALLLQLAALLPLVLLELGQLLGLRLLELQTLFPGG